VNEIIGSLLRPILRLLSGRPLPFRIAGRISTSTLQWFDVINDIVGACAGSLAGRWARVTRLELALCSSAAFDSALRITGAGGALGRARVAPSERERTPPLTFAPKRSAP
jgi:hypothetical protein